MQIELIAVGKRLPNWIDTGVKTYAKRLPQYIQFKLTEIAPATRHKNNDVARYKQKEQEAIEAILAPKQTMIVLDVSGQSMSSLKLAQRLQCWRDDNQSVALIIGGADGLSDSLKNKAAAIWSLSSMTLPHGLVRVIILEQIYRAASIMQNHPYHRE